MAKDPDKAATRIAARQHGLITWRQALVRAGLTEGQVRWRVSSKRWRRVRRGVFAVSGVRASWEQSVLAAQLSARTERVIEKRKKVRLEELEDAAVAGRSAVWLRGCKRLDKPSHHELLVARLRAPAIKGAVVRRTWFLPATDVETVNGVPTLAIPRLAVELCGELPDVDFVAVLDDLLGNRGSELRAEVHARAVQLRPGRPAVARVIQLTEPGAAAVFRSWLERHTASLFDAAGLPPPLWNLELRDDDGKKIGIGDAVWVEQRVVVELDGLRFHSSAEQRRRDNRKDRRLGTIGWLVLRYTWLDVMERPDEVAAEVRGTLERRRVTLRV